MLYVASFSQIQNYDYREGWQWWKRDRDIRFEPLKKKPWITCCTAHKKCFNLGVNLLKRFAGVFLPTSRHIKRLRVFSCQGYEFVQITCCSSRYDKANRTSAEKLCSKHKNV